MRYLMMKLSSHAGSGVFDESSAATRHERTDVGPTGSTCQRAMGGIACVGVRG